MKALPNNNVSLTDNFPIMKPLLESQIRSGVRFIVNNEKPATHYVDVVVKDFYHSQKVTAKINEISTIVDIDALPMNLVEDERHGYTTIAMFKIRTK